MPMLKVLLTPDERQALLQLAEREKRDPRAQAAVILRQELRRCGLLPAESITFALHPQIKTDDSAQLLAASPF